MSGKILNLIEGNNVFLESRPDGIKINVEIPENNTASGDYTGYFKIIQTGDLELKVNNGANADDATAGYATINGTNFTVAAATKEVTESGFLYLEWEWDSGTETIQTATLEVSAAYPAYETNKAKTVLASFTVADSKITNIYQQQHGCINSIILGACT